MSYWGQILWATLAGACRHGTRLRGCPPRRPRAVSSSFMPRNRVPCQPALAVGRYSQRRAQRVFCAGKGGARRAGDTEQNARCSLLGAQQNRD